MVKKCYQARNKSTHLPFIIIMILGGREVEPQYFTYPLKKELQFDPGEWTNRILQC